MGRPDGTGLVPAGGDEVLDCDDIVAIRVTVEYGSWSNVR